MGSWALKSARLCSWVTLRQFSVAWAMSCEGRKRRSGRGSIGALRHPQCIPRGATPCENCPIALSVEPPFLRSKQQTKKKNRAAEWQRGLWPRTYDTLTRRLAEIPARAAGGLLVGIRIRILIWMWLYFIATWMSAEFPLPCSFGLMLGRFLLNVNVMSGLGAGLIKQFI